MNHLFTLVTSFVGNQVRNGVEKYQQQQLFSDRQIIRPVGDEEPQMSKR